MIFAPNIWFAEAFRSFATRIAKKSASPLEAVVYIYLEQVIPAGRA